MESDALMDDMAVTSGKTRFDVSTWGRKPPEDVLGMS
jgi:hypothetical protein